MGSVQLNGSGLVASLSPNHNFTHKTKLNYQKSSLLLSKHNATRLSRAKTIRSISTTAPATQPPTADDPDDEPPAVDFAFVHVSREIEKIVVDLMMIFESFVVVLKKNIFK